MLKISMWISILRGIPEAYLFILIAYIFDKKEIDKLRIFFCSVFLGVSSYFIRKLPVHFGVHTILLLLLTIVVIIYFNNIKFNKAIFSTLIGDIILFLCEGINIWALYKFADINVGVVRDKPIMNLYTSPSILTFAFIIFIMYNKFYKVREEKNNVNTKDLK